MTLQEYELINNRKSKKIHLMSVKEYEVPEGLRIRNPEDTYYLAVRQLHIDEYAEERVYAIVVNTRIKPMGLFLISKGTIDTSLISPREILIRALLIGGSGIILIHNHPSSEVQPSAMDLQATQRVRAACELIGIQLFDHIVVGGTYYYSFKEHKEI